MDFEPTSDQPPPRRAGDGGRRPTRRRGFAPPSAASAGEEADGEPIPADVRQRPRRGQRLFQVVLLLVVVAMLGCLAWLWQLQGTLAATLVVPNGRQRVVVGEAITLVASASSGRMYRAELWDNGQPTGVVVENPIPDTLGWSSLLTWEPDSTGRHQLVVRLYDRQGQRAESLPVLLDVLPEGTIAFASNRSGRYSPYVMRLDSQALRQLTPRGRDPVWVDEQTLLLAQDGALWQVSAEGGEPHELVPAEFQASAPSWRQRLAFVSQRSGAPSVLLRDGTGTPATLPGLSEASEVRDPAWSPDGRELVVAANSEGRWDLYRVSLVSGNVSRLTDDPSEEREPAWSPDGRALLFASTREGAPQIYWMDLVLQGEPQAVTAHPEGAGQPSWSPEGDWFVYVGGSPEQPERRELFLQRLSDGYAVRLTDNAADDTDPAWEPGAVAEALLPEDGFFGEFFPNLTLSGAPIATQSLARLDLDWGEEAPLPALPADGFSARWHGRLTVEREGDYRFTLAADDAARLWLDGQLILDGWTVRQTQAVTVPVRLAPGPHRLRIEYYDDRGPARLLVDWAPVEP